MPADRIVFNGPAKSDAAIREAIDAYKRNQFRYGQTLAASKSGVPLAQAYIAKGPDFYGKAEEVLLSVVENNPQGTANTLTFSGNVTAKSINTLPATAQWWRSSRRRTVQTPERHLLFDTA